MHHLPRSIACRAMMTGLLATTAIVPLSNAWAQSQATGSQSVEEEQDSGLKEIIVTAQKRSENLQRVPISITTITADSVKAAGVSSTLDLQTVTPGLTVTKTANSPLLFMRGIGTALGSVGDEGGVNVVVDGVVYTSLPGSVFGMNNIERIEVLRGPQGTLFGRNAAGGVISIITRDPRHETHIDGSVGFGNYQTVSTSLYATTGLSDDVAVDLAIQNYHQGDGFGINRFNGRDVNRTQDFSARSKLLWENGDTKVRLSADYERTGGDNGIARQIIPGALGTAGARYTGSNWDVNSNIQPRLYTRAGGGSLRIEQTLPWARLTSITAYRKTASGYDFDQDAGPVNVVAADFNSHERQFTQELQLGSRETSAFQWIVGAFYLDNKAQNDPTTLSGAAYAPIGGFTSRFGKLVTKSYAGFAQGAYPITASTNITGGVRYTSDKRIYSFLATSGIGIITPQINTSKTFSKLTWRLSVDQQLNDDILLYASVSRGFKSGLFNIINGANPPIEPEVLTSYEAGIKSELLDRHLRINVSGFYYDYNNIQVSQIVTGTSFILNAAKGKIHGVDVDFDVIPFRNLTLSGGAEFLHARYDTFLNAPGTFPSPATCTPTPQLLPGPRTGGNTTCPINASGNQLVRAPDFSLSFTGKYVIPTAIGAFGISGTYSHTASYPFEADGRIRQRPTDIVNGELSWQSVERQLGLRLWVRNLTKQVYYTTFSSSLGDTAAWAPPRTYGATLEMHF